MNISTQIALHIKFKINIRIMVITILETKHYFD